jgi:hypothetical protein
MRQTPQHLQHPSAPIGWGWALQGRKRSRMTSQGRQSNHVQARLATPFATLGLPQKGKCLEADHRVVNIGADRLGAKLFVT